MRVDLRVKHDIEARKAAIGLFELGHGYKSAAIALSLPVEAVRRWQEIYRAFGSEVLLRMDGKLGRYTTSRRPPAAAEIFSRTANGCGHRQIAMCLRAEEGAVIADKTVLKTMREMGIRCGIRRETAYHGYNSYRGVVGRTFENVIARDFDAGAPWRKLGTDVTEFKVAGGKAYWAPTLDFCTKEIVASDISTTPDMAQQVRMLYELLPKIPEGAAPTMHSDRGWQYQRASYTSRLEAAGIVQSMSRKANCIDNAATEQLFGHVKDEFYRGREWKTLEDFKRDPEEYIVHWNTSRRQVRLKGLTPEEFRNQALAAWSLFRASKIWDAVHSWIDRKRNRLLKRKRFLIVLYEREVFDPESPRYLLVRPYLGARNLARLEAGGANVHLATVTIDDDVDALDVGAELTVGDAVRVADGATGNGVLTANFANFGHN